MSERLLIRASAGSGKTFRLSGHFLRQLFLGERPETILATTFTRKAAGEILGRVLTRLAAAASSPQDAAQLAEFLDLKAVSQESALQVLASLTHSLHRVRICTLDSFFQQVARSLSLELGLPAGWKIIDEWMEEDLQQQAIDAVLAGQAVSDARDLMHRLSKDRSKRSVRELIAECVSTFYTIWQVTSDEAWNVVGRGRSLKPEPLAAAIASLRELDLTGDKRFAGARDDDAARAEAAQWDEFLTKGLAAKVFLDEGQFYKKPIPADVESAYRPLVQHARAELLRQLAQQNEATRDLIAQFDREYRRLQRDHGWLRFGDVTRAVGQSQAAGDGARMAFRLDQSIRHLLLDEFQDTSPDQWRILKAITNSIVSSRQRTSFFCVGDPKQAIYGWRGGEAAILNAVEQTVPGLTSEPLDKSRRSSPVIIDVVNRIFQHAANHGNLAEDADACRNWVRLFPAHDTALHDAPGYARFVTAPEPEGESKGEQRADYLPWAADEIERLYRQHPGFQIGVLTRKNETVSRLVHALAERGVPASEEGGTPPVDSPAALAVLSLLHLASHPGCTVSRFHVARSPLGQIAGLTDWRDKSQALSTAAMLRARLLDDGYGRTLQWLTNSVRESCSRRDTLRLQQIVAAAWQFDTTPSLNPCDFIRLIESSRFGSAEQAPVRVMTIHQSKGLEFDVVVLPELDADLVRVPAAAVGRTSAEFDPDRVCIWRSKSLLPMLPQNVQEAFQQTRDRQMTESLCLLYVAVTRAVHSLHLLAMPLKSSKLPRTFQGLLVAALADNQVAPPNSVLFESGDPDWYSSLPAEAIVTDVRSFCVADRQQPLQLQPMPHGRRRGLARHAPSQHDEQRLFFSDEPARGAALHGDRIDPLTRGSVMHAWFEMIRWLDDQPIPAEQELRRVAERLATPAETIDDLLPQFSAFHALKPVQSLFHRAQFVGQELPQLAAELAGGQVELEVTNERPFAWLDGRAIVQGTIDRLVLVRRGRTVIAADILDYKTDRLVGERAEWIRSRVEHYAGQLNDYRRAVSHMYRLPLPHVTARLVLLEAAAVEVIPP